MNFKKTLLLALPLLGVAVGSLVAFNSKSVSVAEAADYSTSAKDFKLNTSEGNSVSATFTVSNSNLEMKGWLLCLFTDEPAYDLDTRKLIGSDGLHPFGRTECAHYFYAACTQREGKMSITWAANAADQKIESLWNEDSSTSETENLAKYMTDGNDYHIVIGPRHRETSWAKGEDIGGGKDFIWENCDYYVGRKNSLLNGVDGQTYLDLTEFSDWKTDNDKFAFYYWGGDYNGWSEFATPTAFDNIYVAQYSLDFVPTGMKAVRISSSAESPSWDVKHNEGKNEDFAEYGVIGITGWDGSSWSYKMAGIKFGEDNIVTLDHLKRNTAGNSENFNQGFPLSADQEFDIDFNNVTYSTFEIHSSLTSNFDTTSVSGKVRVIVGGIYALYFNTDTHSLYITTVALAEADEWSIAFLGDGCASTKSKTNWDKFEDDFDDLSDEAKEILESEEHVAHDAEVTGYIALAMQRYDFLVSNFAGFDDYIGRCDSQHFSPYQSGALVISNGENNALLIIIAVTAVSLISFTTLLVFKKRKSIR